MRFSLASLCLPLQCFKGPSSTTTSIQPTQTARIQRPEPVRISTITDVTDAYFMVDHGYSPWSIDNGGIMVMSKRYDESCENPVIHLYIDTEHRVTTIYSNNLRSEKTDGNNLPISEIYKSLCHRTGITHSTMRWIAMDVDNDLLNSAITKYRETNSLVLGEISLTRDDGGWNTFADTKYYELAAQMMQGIEIDRIVISSQKRLMRDGTAYVLASTEVIMFSFKQNAVKNKAADNKNLEDATKAAGDALAVDLKTLYDSRERSCQQAA
ncbi:hypothetical protein CFIMG_008667RA00001 [Ceratocystis fimbriata CBS 114723]|uniref:Uncharacterized protein n=1 Tax=Ceratocystis fimbriata CBS 114723 TaxID=1035309 RepID=A0A2C5WZN7_9PEZI|nr:hypothetical protein CFIMG_008667RA00001 [Ceratocystis fimbriata CBS 114723]